MNPFVCWLAQQRHEIGPESLHYAEPVKVNHAAVSITPKGPAPLSVRYFRFCLPVPFPFAFPLPLPSPGAANLTCLDEALFPFGEVDGLDWERLGDFKIERGVCDPDCALRPRSFLGAFFGVGALLEALGDFVLETIFNLCLLQSSSLSLTK